ncbi:exosortase C-terminal domain/associated protein EpsI [Candidatus Omnitrophota bacterium]
MNNRNFIIAIVILVIALISVHALIYVRGEYAVVEKGFYKLPMQIGEWKAESFEYDQRVYDVLNAQEHLSRNYFLPNGTKLGLYIGYYSTKRGGHPEHIPAGCYTGAGFGIESNESLVINSASGERTITVNNFYAKKGEIGEQVLFWLHNYRGVDMNTGLKQNIEKMKNKLLNRRNDGAFIRINSKVSENREEVLAHQKEFVAQLIDLLPDCWPVEEIKR